MKTKLIEIYNAITRLEKSKTKYDILSCISDNRFYSTGSYDYINTDVNYYTKKECLAKKENALKYLNDIKGFYLYISILDKKSTMFENLSIVKFCIDNRKYDYNILKIIITNLHDCKYNPIYLGVLKNSLKFIPYNDKFTNFEHKHFQKNLRKLYDTLKGL